MYGKTLGVPEGMEVDAMGLEGSAEGPTDPRVCIDCNCDSDCFGSKVGGMYGI